MNRLLTTLVQLMLWAPIIFAITLAVNEQKREKNK
jgi:ABC-type spermidine/putrescine transport system permease subunit II